MKKWFQNQGIMLVAWAMLVIMAGGTILIRCYFNKLSASVEQAKTPADSYQRHYAFIAEEQDDSFIQCIYEGAYEAGVTLDCYVEWMGANLSEDYSTSEQLGMAIAANVDGIILEGDKSDDTRETIRLANEAHIPVVTVSSDCPSSARQSYIGMNHYSLGQMYGEQIKKLADGQKKITVDVVLDEDAEQSIIYGTLCQTLEDSKTTKFKVIPVRIQKEVSFEAEEKIRDRIAESESLPDYMVCLDELSSTCAIQSVIDQNKVGKVKLFGFYENNIIRDAITEEVMQSAITVDAKTMGEDCILALEEYIENGYVNEYISVEPTLITKTSKGDLS